VREGQKKERSRLYWSLYSFREFYKLLYVCVYVSVMVSRGFFEFFSASVNPPLPPPVFGSFLAFVR
jgi:hypothetical protein